MGSFLYWIVVGLIAGWLAGKVMKGGGYGVLVDNILGILGGVALVEQAIAQSMPLVRRRIGGKPSADPTKIGRAHV